MSLRVGDALVLSFPMARNVSDAIAHSFSEVEYQYYAIGAILQKHVGRDMPFDKIGICYLRYWNRNMPEHTDVPDMAADALCMNGELPQDYWKGTAMKCLRGI